MIGQTLGQTFLTPSRDLTSGHMAAQQQAVKQQQPIDMVGSVMTDLDPVAMEGDLNLTQSYYAKAAMLKQFQQSMLVSAGIDVTAPDLSNTASIQASDAFMQGLGELQALGNQLQQSQKVRTADLASQRSGALRQIPDADPSLETQVRTGDDFEQRYYPTATDPEGDHMRELAMRTYYDENQVKELNDNYIIPYREQQQAILNDPRATPMAKAKANENKNRVPLVTKSKREFAPHRERVPTQAELNAQDKKDASLIYYNQAANVLLGQIKDPKVTVDKDGNVIMYDETFSGVEYGAGDYTLKGKKMTFPKIIESIYVKDGKTFARFMQPSVLLNKQLISDSGGAGDVIQDEPINNAGKFVEQIIDKNKNLGFNTTDLLSALKEAELLNKTTKLSDDKKAVGQINIKPPSKEEVKEIIKSLDTIIGQVAKNANGTVRLNNGQALTVKKHKYTSNLYIEIDGEEQITGLTREAAVDWIRENTDYIATQVKAKIKYTQQGEIDEDI